MTPTKKKMMAKISFMTPFRPPLGPKVCTRNPQTPTSLIVQYNQRQKATTAMPKRHVEIRGGGSQQRHMNLKAVARGRRAPIRSNPLPEGAQTNWQRE